jgi:hypothetical protein
MSLGAKKLDLTSRYLVLKTRSDRENAEILHQKRKRRGLTFYEAKKLSISN